MPRPLNTLRARLLLLVLFAMLPSVALLGYSFFDQHQQAVQRAERETLALVRGVAHEQRQTLANTELTLAALAQLPALREPSAQCHTLLSNLLTAHPQYTNLAVADRNGDIFCSALPLAQPVNITDRTYFRRALDVRAFSAGDYQIGRITGRAAVNYGYPQMDAAGGVQNVIFAALDLRWVEEAAVRADLPSGSVLLLVDQGGNVLGRFPDAELWSGQSLADVPLVRAILAHPEGATLATVGLDGIERLYGFAAFHRGESGGAYVAAGIPTGAAWAEARSGFTRDMALLSLVAALALIAAWVGSNVFVLRRVQALSGVSRRLAHGDLEARSGLPHGEDEFGRLALSFDDMATSLQRVDRAMRTLSAGNRALVRATDEPTLLQEICDIVVEVGGYQCAWVCYVDGPVPQASLRVVAQAGTKLGTETSEAPERAPREDATTARAPTAPMYTSTLGAIESAAPLVLKDFHSARGRAGMPTGCRAMAVFPLHIDKRAQGALVICARDPDTFDAEALKLLEETAGDLAYGIGNLRVRSERQHAQDMVHRMAYYDPLTTLPNHALLETRMQTLLLGADDAPPRFALLVVSLERFREINEALGFHQGDALLKAVAGRLTIAMPEDAMVVRLRGDEFAVLLVERETQAATVLARRIREALDAPFLIDGLTLHISAVIGIALAPEQSSDAAVLARLAEVAARQAKRARRGYAMYDNAEDADGPQRLAMASDLRRAIDEGELVLHFQPQIDLGTMTWCGMEALVRWQHPERGLVPPDLFVPLAEHTGLIKPLTLWVLEAALHQAAAWRSHGITLPVAVNLSAWNLRDLALLTKVKALFERYGAGPGWLEFEITESAMMEDPQGALATLKDLSALGITLSIDDFGTGYSSLSYLTQLPVNAVKIDKSFVNDMLLNADAAAIVRSTIGLAHDLDLTVVAEGVEDEATSNRLASWGCDVGQGYYYGKPMLAEQLSERLKKGKIA